MTTTNVNVADPTATNANSQNLEKIFEDLVKRANTTEVVLAIFRCMDTYAVINHKELSSYLTNEASTDTSTGKVLPVFTGEIFSKERIAPLMSIRKEVTAFLKNSGALIGQSGTYVIPTSLHKDVVDFLENAKKRYLDYLNGSLLAHYDEIMEQHRLNLQKSIKNQKVLDAIMKKLPSKQDIADKHSCYYQVMGAKLPAPEEIQQREAEIHAMYDAVRQQDLAFLGKVTELFKEFSTYFGDGDRLGKKFMAFNKAVDTALGFEQTISIVMADEFKPVADSAFALLHELKNKICVTLTQRQRKELKEVLLRKMQLAAYVLSDTGRLKDYAAGQIQVLEPGFNLFNSQTNSQTQTQPQKQSIAPIAPFTAKAVSLSDFARELGITTYDATSTQQSDVASTSTADSNDSNNGEHCNTMQPADALSQRRENIGRAINSMKELLAEDKGQTSISQSQDVVDISSMF